MPRGVLIDLSGVIYDGTCALPGAVESLQALQASGLPWLCITNTTRQRRRDIARDLQALGFAISEAHILSAVDATHQWLATRQRRPSLLVHPAVVAEFLDLDRRDPDTVVLGDAADGFSYRALNRAFRLLLQGAELVTMGDNRYFRDLDQGLSLDIGPFRALLEHASGVSATVVGKPAPTFFTTACERLGLDAKDVLVIGDDAEHDVAAGMAIGLQGCLVRTGKYRPGDEARCPGAQVVADFSAAVAPLLRG